MVVSAAREAFCAAANTVATIKAARTFFPADITLTEPRRFPDASLAPAILPVVLISRWQQDISFDGS
jgi:hypothetical protein